MRRTTHNRNSRFFQLSGEIRNRIYELTFSRRTPVNSSSRLFWHFPGLVEACRQSYIEGLDIWYSCTDFYVRDTPRLPSWLRSLSVEKANLITSIHHTGVKKSGRHATYTGQQFLDRMARLRVEMASEGIIIGEGVIKAPVDIGRMVWTSSPDRHRRMPTWDWNMTDDLTDEDDDQ